MGLKSKSLKEKRERKRQQASSIPSFEVLRTETVTPNSPHGAKGAGDVAINGVPPTIVSAVCNAIGIPHLDMPLTPEKVWHAIQSRP